ncbi:SPOR domain-containing protein [Thiocystis violascens]|uniref:SPOR domain-containing protein n=1 Tax=Thiocystis violascens (strain ATCC 17096 / DSM 198 / 6111) TaxID=765911 RepID=I3Y6U0_THIV6|nr:SPOR domain-containing protein [Thiocystis violascens]AFL72708.1 hypothetical protein Thivi_0654 [Thiocystis violascens DSM 198]
MREGAKRRLAGAVAIVALAVIFVPMFFEKESLAPPSRDLARPNEPDFDDPALTELAPDPPTGQVTEERYADLPIESDPLTLPVPAGADEANPGGEADQDRQPEKPVRRDSPATQPDRLGRLSTESPPVVKEVEAVAPPKARDDGMPSWVIQVASLGTAQSAAELETKLRSAGFSAFVEKAEVRGKQYYRVRVGPEVDRASAERAATRLRQQQKLDTLIQRYP